MVGSKAITIPAAKIFHCTPAFEIIEYKPTGTVYLSDVFRNNTAVKSSFQLLTKEKLNIADNPGNINGITTLNKALIFVHPSIKAASSISSGILAKNPLAIMVLNDAPNPE